MNRSMLKTEAAPGVVPMTERRLRTTRGIVVFIDGDSHRCDRAARELEVDGYHVLTADNPWEGVELVAIRRPDAVVASVAQTVENCGVLADIVAANMPAHGLLIICCIDSALDCHREVVPADDSRVLRVHGSLSADRLGGLLKRVVDKRRSRAWR